MRDGIAIQDRVFVTMSETPKPAPPKPTPPAPTPPPSVPGTPTPPQPTPLPSNPPPLEVPDTGERPRRDPERPLRRP